MKTNTPACLRRTLGLGILSSLLALPAFAAGAEWTSIFNGKPSAPKARRRNK